jgi:methionyl-tRNA synthetase
MVQRITDINTSTDLPAPVAQTSSVRWSADAPDSRAPWFVTTAIPFVNSTPHLGFAMEAILTDALARYHRLRGEDVRFLTGTDENSLKNVQAAEKEGISTAALVERNAGAFRDLGPALDLSFDDFIRTSAEDRHARGVTKLWNAIAAKGDLYKQSYEGLYCVGCEQFYDPGDLVDGLCPEHRTPPERIAEENWFFRLSQYRDPLLEVIESGRLRIEPDKRKNEVVSFLRGGLQDLSVSRSRERSRGWGVPVPGDPDQVMYVWFDALGNYITALDYAAGGDLYQRYWTGNPNRVHVIGKGITRFHAVYWPAFLLAAGEPLPTDIFVHGYVTVGGEKISKSLGNVIDPVALAESYGKDQLRYFLLAHIRSTDDGDFTFERFARAVNADLANQFGNLLNRTVNMIGRYFEGQVPTPGTSSVADAALVDAASNMAGAVDAAFESFLTHEAAAAIWNVIDRANKYLVIVEPWALAKLRAEPGAAGEEAASRLATCLYTTAEALRLCSVLAAPIIPAASARALQQLGSPALQWPAAAAWGGLAPGTRVQPGEVLFPRIELEEGEADE